MKEEIVENLENLIDKSTNNIEKGSTLQGRSEYSLENQIEIMKALIFLIKRK